MSEYGNGKSVIYPGKKGKKEVCGGADYCECECEKEEDDGFFGHMKIKKGRQAVKKPQRLY